MSVNKVMVLGRLGQDPELKYTPSGQPVCNFSIATTESWTDKNGTKQERTEWHRIVVWGKIGELCNQYLSKGRQSFIEGRLQTRSWEDKNNQKRYTTEIIASKVEFLGDTKAKSNKDDSNDVEGDMSTTSHSYDVSSDANFTADDIPF